MAGRDKVSFSITVSGKVQGVGYRYFAQKEAYKHGVTGWVRNMANGNVEIYAEGSVQQVDRFVDNLRQGPSHSNVQDIQIQNLVNLEGCNSFEIRY